MKEEALYDSELGKNENFQFPSNKGKVRVIDELYLNPQLGNSPYFRSLYQTNNNVLKELQYSIDNRPFSCLLSSSVNSPLSMDESSAKTMDNMSTLFGTTYNYLQDSIASDESYSFSLEFVDTYSFSIEPEDKRSHPMDRRIAITIAEILKRFFAVNTNAMIMVCDSTDGKEFKRRKLFDRWFEHFSDDSILKYDASAPLSEYQLFISLYISKNNPNREKLLYAFSKLMENDLYGLGI